MSQDSSERRAHERHPVRFEVEARPADGGPAARMQARNLSMGGLFCVSAVGDAPMTRLEGRLLLPALTSGSEELTVGATVVRRVERPEAPEDERWELALLFTGLGDDLRERLEHHLTADPED